MNVFMGLNFRGVRLGEVCKKPCAEFPGFDFHVETLHPIECSIVLTIGAHGAINPLLRFEDFRSGEVFGDCFHRFRFSVMRENPIKQGLFLAETGEVYSLAAMLSNGKKGKKGKKIQGTNFHKGTDGAAWCTGLAEMLENPQCQLVGSTDQWGGGFPEKQQKEVRGNTESGFPEKQQKEVKGNAVEIESQ
jgi:hypothetical protein